MGGVVVGQEVIGQDGLPTKVLATSPIQLLPTYEVTFDNGEIIYACADHQWVTETARERANNSRRSASFRKKRKLKRPLRGKGIRPDLALQNSIKSHQYLAPTIGSVKTTKEIFDTQVVGGRNNHSIVLTKPVSLPEKNLIIAPYMLGTWLGDGHSSANYLTTNDPETLTYLEELGYPSSKMKAKYAYKILNLKDRLVSLSLIKNKHIPPEYLLGSYSQRLELLQGLMDTDGYCAEDGEVQFCNTNKDLADGVAYLAASLGVKVFRKTKTPTLNGKDCSLAYLVSWTNPLPCFKLKRKLKRLVTKENKNNKHYIVSVRKVADRLMKCICVENREKLYLCSNSLVPTHNSMLARWALIVWCSKIPGLQTAIFRLTFDDVIGNHMQGETSFPMLLAPWVNSKLVTITQTEVRFNFNNSLISLEHVSDDRALLKHQGRAKHVIVFEEATQIRERHMRWLRTWLTMSEEMKERVPEEWKGRFPRILYTSNPMGTSAAYFRRHFVKARPFMEIGQAPMSEGGFLRQYIPALVSDNPSEDAEATFRRVSGIGDVALTKALLEGDWDSPIGDYFPQFDERKHMVPNFSPPEHWFKFITFDWGSSDPFAVYWWCVSDGIEFTDGKGNKRWFPRGSLIAYREWYGCQQDDQAKGLEMRNVDVAEGIKWRSMDDKMSGLVITDSLPFQDRGMEKGGKKYTIADIFHEAGVALQRGNTSRIHGWSQVRDRLIGKDGLPLIYFVHNCKYLNEYLPSLGRSKNNPEDAEEDGEASHCSDCVRLACCTRPLVLEAKPEPDFKTANLWTPKRILRQLINNKNYGR